VVNVGSVGQPRDGDPRACYVLVNEQRVWYHRVSYDVEKTAGKMERVSALTAHLSERLHEGR
jgi:diadenosine tetraphosphatase ApaH/serine/threonine PP2A family protein phosphatase